MSTRTRSLLFFILVFLSGLLINLAIPTWWAFSPIAFLVSFWLGATPSQAFWKGFTAIGLAWLVLILFWSIPNDNILARRMALFFYLPHWTLLVLLAALLAGALGGFSSLCGFLVKGVIQKK
jgi:hypothetical protein